MLEIKNDVFIQHVESLGYDDVEKLIEKVIPRKNYDRVIIKPNLCFSEKIPGATTSPELVRYVTRYFKKHAKEVVVVESDALLNTADEAFDNLGIRKIVDEEGGNTVNLSKHYPDGYLSILFPHDLFVNLPVLKTHEFALVTGAVKNMFGMIPDKKRIKYHPIIHEKLVELCQKYNKQLVIVDGIKGMEGHGPTRGKTVSMNILIAGTNPAAVDKTICKIMGFSLDEVPHIKYAVEKLDANEVEVKCDGIEFDKIIRQFERPKLDPVTAGKMWVWRHKTFNNIFFASPLYKVTRAVGLRIRKFTRFALRMEKID